MLDTVAGAADVEIHFVVAPVFGQASARSQMRRIITTLLQATAHLQYVDGAMLGRAAYDHPYLFAEADALYFGDAALPHTRRQVLDAILSYLECWIAQGLPPYRIVRHLLNLFAYQRAARLWKRSLSECTWAPDTAMAALREAMRLVPDEVLDAPPQTAEYAMHSGHLCDTL